jgi:hypothetical protein
MGCSVPDRRWARVLTAAALAGLAACSVPTAATQAPSARIAVGTGGTPSVVLSSAGAERLGLRTALAAPAGTLTSIPYAALLYEPDGAAVVYTVTGPRTYTRRVIVVSAIQGSVVYVSRGLAPGTEVVTAGAEELLGVQEGVGVQR